MTALMLLTALFGSPDPFLAATADVEVGVMDQLDAVEDFDADPSEPSYRGVEFLLAGFEARAALADFR